MAKLADLKPGQTVTWASQAGGRWKCKTGKVLAIIPARQGTPSGVIPAGTPISRIKFGSYSRSERNRVIVAVERPNNIGIFDYYAPSPLRMKIIG